MVRNLNVFLSSSIGEFRSERERLHKKICNIPFLECRLQENEPHAQNTVASSLNAVNACDILVGILGNCDSELTRDEIVRSIDAVKYTLIYLKKSNGRDKKLDMFIQDYVKAKVTYFEFNGKRDLYSKITEHLENHIHKLLIRGLEHFKDEQQNITTRKKKTETETWGNNKKMNSTAKDILLQAKESFDRNDHLSAVIKCGIALEIALRDCLVKIDQIPRHDKKQPVGRLTRMLVNMELLDSLSEHDVHEISAMRNVAVHEGRVPDRRDVQTALELTARLLIKINQSTDGGNQ